MTVYDYNFVLNSLATEIEIYTEMDEKSRMDEKTRHKKFIEKLNLQLDEIEKEKREREGDRRWMKNL